MLLQVGGARGSVPSPGPAMRGQESIGLERT